VKKDDFDIYLGIYGLSFRFWLRYVTNEDRSSFTISCTRLDRKRSGD
jgi:hypothetical protein